MKRRYMGRGLRLAALFGVLACAQVTTERVVPYIGPHYARWWSQVESCLGRTARMQDVTFLAWTGPGYPSVGDSRVEGWYIEETKELGVVDPLDSMIVRHEMAHAIAPADGTAHQPDIGKKCSGVIRWP